MKTLWRTLGLLGLGACGSQGDRIGHEQAALLATVERARALGAYGCAPEELAYAEAHLEFARIELDEGDGPRAREHLVLAAANARAAFELSRSSPCAQGQANAEGGAREPR